jgi:hypothetical protein
MLYRERYEFVQCLKYQFVVRLAPIVHLFSTWRLLWLKEVYVRSSGLSPANCRIPAFNEPSLCCVSVTHRTPPLLP